MEFDYKYAERILCALKGELSEANTNKVIEDVQKLINVEKIKIFSDANNIINENSTKID